MGQPVVENGVPFSLSNGSNTVSRAFSLGKATKHAGGFPLVCTDARCGGVPFSASLLTVVVTAEGLPVVLVGAVITCTDGYVGTPTAAQGAGAKFDLA